ncbi:MAG TPA: glycosyltransferase [Candidatus Moranbacteria bacterium]|nr:glycosyltransferase [Candidatus Moranbacteria bacterium]
MPELSVVVPVFNGKKYIKNTIQSLVRISEKIDTEVIFQDALSTDGTSEIIEKCVFQHGNFFHHREKDSGQSDAINRGIKKAKGKWVTWLCADDLFLDKFVDMFNKLNKENNLDIIYGDCVFLKDKILVPAVGTETYEKGKLSKKRLFIQQPGTCILKKEWDRHCGLDVGLNWTMDYDLFLRLENSNLEFKRFSDFVSVARIHDEAKTSSGNFLRFIEHAKIFARIHRKKINNFRPTPYAVYFIEYIIKKMEAEKSKSFFLKILHGLFWKMAKPTEKDKITEMFNKQKNEIEKNILFLESQKNEQAK